MQVGDSNLPPLLSVHICPQVWLPGPKINSFLCLVQALQRVKVAQSKYWGEEKKSVFAKEERICLFMILIEDEDSESFDLAVQFFLCFLNMVFLFTASSGRHSNLSSSHTIKRTHTSH